MHGKPNRNVRTKTKKYQLKIKKDIISNRAKNGRITDILQWSTEDRERKVG